jgi:catechol 2,3-dioxygenase
MPINPQAHIGAVHLTVADLERSLIFYRQQLGFADVWLRDGSAGLGVADRVLLVLHESEHAPRPHRTTGLYHFAILVPSRLELARSLRHFAEIGTRMQGFSDHQVSERCIWRIRTASASRCIAIAPVPSGERLEDACR